MDEPARSLLSTQRTAEGALEELLLDGLHGMGVPRRLQLAQQRLELLVLAPFRLTKQQQQ